MNNKVPEFFKLFDLKPGDRFEISDGDCNPYRFTEKYQVLNCENTDCTSDELFLSLLYGNSTVKKLPKITEKEDQILHALYDLGWKWIARNENEDLHVFHHVPVKYNTKWIGGGSHPIPSPLYEETDFQFIRWEDEEPFSIEKYVEEYGQ